MKKINIIYSIPFICALLLLSNDFVFAQRDEHRYVGDSKGETYRERLIDYADIYSYEVNERTKDTIAYVRRINDYWYGIFGTANFGLSFGDFKSLVDPKNEYNIFNAVIDFYSQFGAGYTFGLVGEWIRPTSDLSFGMKLGAFDRKISNIGASNVKIDIPTFDGDYDFRAKLTYLTLNPYVKYMFPQFDGFFATAGIDFNIAYSSLAYLEKTYTTTGYIYHKMDIEDIKGNPRFLINLGVGYDFFIADFFSANNRVRITPFLDLKGGTNIITSHNSNWNDVTVNIGLQIKLAPDKIKIDTLYYDPASETPVNYMANIRDEIGLEFPGFSGLLNPPSFEMAMINFIEHEYIETETKVGTEIVPIGSIEIAEQPQPKSASVINLILNIPTDVPGRFETSTSTSLTKEQQRYFDQLAIYMKENPRVTVRIEGHSDNRGSTAKQREIANARANAGVNYLVAQGITRKRLLNRGRAALEPIATNNTEEGRRKNRRVSVILLTK
jgi:outer membrane protein OmpA-like peptidoglycan-associated protein